MDAYYNENDPFAAAWLRQLIGAGLITPGFVDERDIRDVQPGDLAGYERCHFFAGIAGWDLALQLAGLDGPVWTGSCPCQPFSAAGKGQGFNDTRHLWPTWFRLIRECQPPVVFGEQVASADGLAWFDHVSTDLEGEGYAIGAADLCAAGVGAPHIRQRLWFVADANGRGCGSEGEPGRLDEVRKRAAVVGLPIEGAGSYGRLANAERAERWSEVIWLPCRDGKARPTQPGLFPLAHGVRNRVGTLRGAGNAIVPACAAEFIQAYREAVSA